MNEASRPPSPPVSEGALWRVEMFGGLRVRRLSGAEAGKLLDSFRTQKAASLLAFLALDRRMHTREWLANLMWPETPINASRNSLRVTLSWLRTTLETPEEKGRVLRSSRESIGAGEALTSDLEEFRFWLGRAGNLEGAERTAAWEAAFELVTGPFLRGVYEDWAVSAARRFEREFLEVARRVITLYEQKGDLLRALDCARHAAMVVPDSDSMMRDIIRLGLLAGESASVKQEFEIWKKRLLDNGITGSPDWNELVGRVNSVNSSQIKTLILPNAPDESSSVIGTSSENSDSGNGAHGSAGVPSPPGAPVLRPRDLPVPLSSFVGRAEAREEINFLLNDPEERLVTLLGPGGAGKTRLALEVARDARASGNFEAVAWVAAATIGSMRIVHNALCDALGVFPEGSDLAALSTALGGSGVTGRLLFVFDNFEHLGSEGVRWLDALLDAVPRATALVTSRVALRSEGERLWILPPLLSVENLIGNATSVADTTYRDGLPDAVRLFVERAALVRPDFSPSSAELEEIARICQALGGLPLAIEVAAARLALFSPAQLALEIENARQPLLVKAGASTLRRNGLLLERTSTSSNGTSPSMLDWPNRDVTAPARHRSLREAIDWSVRQLPVQARSFWTRASVFRDAFSLDAASEVCEEPNPAPLLLSLRDSSLLSLQKAGHVPRALWNDALREFAQTLLSTSERTRLEARHATYFARYAREMGDLAGVGVDGVPVILGENEESQNLARRVREELDASRADFRAAFEWFLTREPEASLEMGAYIWATWAANKRWTEGRSLLTRALDAAPSPSEEMPSEGDLTAWKHSWKLRARALEGTGALASLSYDVRSARAIFDLARAAFERAGDAAGVARCLNAAGLAALQGGDLNAARAMAEQSLSLEDEAQRNEGRYALFNLSLVAIVNGDFQTVRQMATEALALHRAQNDLHGVALCLESLGQVAVLSGNNPTARVYFEAARKNFQTLGIDAGVMRSWWGLGHVARGEENFEAARTCFLLALDGVGSSEHYWAFPYILEGLALLANDTGDCGRAVRLLEAAKRIRRTQDIGLPWPFFGSQLRKLEISCKKELGEGRFDAERIVGESLSREDLIAFARS